jgi:hypothetical protein
MGQITESIFSGLNFIVPLADVQHIERHWYPGDRERTKQNYRGLIVVTKHTTWDADIDTYANSLYIFAGEEAESFIQCWCRYRAELEADTIINIHGSVTGFEALDKLGA